MAAGQSFSSRLDSVTRWVPASTICAASALALLLVGCSSGGETPLELSRGEVAPPTLDPSTLRLPFLVDDYYVPNGCFGDNDCQGTVIDINGRGCSENRPLGAQSVCRLFTYTPLAAGAAGYQGFLGILFQDVALPGKDGIGEVPGLPVESGAKRVVFWASLESGEPVTVHFRAGGANNWEGNHDPNLPYADTFGVPLSVMVTTEPQRLTIDVTSVTYQTVVSPFGWAIESQGRTAPIQLYIDDLRWE